MGDRRASKDGAADPVGLEGIHVGADTVRRVLLAVILSGLLGGCVVAEPPVVTAPPPPVAPVEVVPVAPGPGYVWVAGHWAWRRHGYIWVPGHWECPRRRVTCGRRSTGRSRRRIRVDRRALACKIEGGDT